MAEAKVGVLTAGEINGPLPVKKAKWLDFSSPSTWAVLFFLLAVLLLVVG